VCVCVCCDVQSPHSVSAGEISWFSDADDADIAVVGRGWASERFVETLGSLAGAGLTGEAHPGRRSLCDVVLVANADGRTTWQESAVGAVACGHRVVCIVDHEDRWQVRQSIAAGASVAGCRDVLDELRERRAGHVRVPAWLAADMAHPIRLTSTEAAVAAAIGGPEPLRVVAERLRFSDSYVRREILSIARKLGVTSGRRNVQLALEQRGLARRIDTESGLRK
jgi:DNA-binding NarL/FixJ family response regulator